MIMRLYLLFLYNKKFLSHHPPIFCTFSLLEEKNCTKRETGKGARKPSVPSDEPKQGSDNHYGEAVRKGSGTSPLLRCPKNATARRSSLAFFDRGHSPVAAASAPGGAAAGSPSTPIGFARQPS